MKRETCQYEHTQDQEDVKFEWCRGQGSNLRSASARQIYSLLPLTTRPPLHREADVHYRHRTATLGFFFRFSSKNAL